VDPISAILVAMWVAGYFTRNIYQDSVFKARGQDPPSFRRQEERRARRAGREPLTERQEARRFWVNAWEDAWEAAEERRARAHAKRVEDRRGGWAEEDLADAEDEAHERNRGRDEAERPPDAVPDVPAEDPAFEPAWPEEPEAEPLPGDPADDRREDRPAAAWPPADPDPTPERATVIWPDAWNRKDPQPAQEETPMTAESHNLAAALAYTNDMSVQSRVGVASAETSIAGMTGGGVTGPTIVAMQAAMEALSQAAAYFQNAHNELEHHIAVREAYVANQGAGERSYVTTE
jgi:hypothetical protein